MWFWTWSCFTKGKNVLNNIIGTITGIGIRAAD